MQRWSSGCAVDGAGMQGMGDAGGCVGAKPRSDVDEMDLGRQRVAARAVERCMNVTELQTVLGYLNLGLAIAHSQGVTIGHFGNGDFIGLAETVNGLLLRAVTPVVAAPVVAAPAAPVAPVVAVAQTAAPVAVGAVAGR